jgi:streptomycin 6-kinase
MREWWDRTTIDACWDTPSDRDLYTYPNIASFASHSTARRNLVDSLPIRLTQLANQLGVTFASPLPAGVSSVAFAARTTTDEPCDVVVKIYERPEPAAAESAALKLLSRVGTAPRLVTTIPGIVVLERIRPAEPFRTIAIPTTDQIARVGHLIAFLSTLEPHTPTRELAALEAVDTSNTLAWASQVDSTHTTVYPAALLADLADRRLALAPLHMYCHGDLHGGNLLYGPSSRLYCIDPNHVMGDPASDAARFALMTAVDAELPVRTITSVLADAIGVAHERVLVHARYRAVQAGIYLAKFDPDNEAEVSGYARAVEELCS